MVATEPATLPQCRVIKAFRGVENRMYEPGEIVTIDARWPFHRMNDLVKQRYLLPLAPRDEPARKDTKRGN